jgi:hypothetical protein
MRCRRRDARSCAAGFTGCKLSWFHRDGAIRILARITFKPNVGDYRMAQIIPHRVISHIIAVYRDSVRFTLRSAHYDITM